MSSYQSNPDTQSYQFRPFELPYNQIMQTVQAKTQFWLQGANQLKSAYQSAAGLDLSLDSNRSALGEFSKQANESINQAAKSDLSISDNVNGAMKIFDPLYDGQSEFSQNIMGDHAVTTKAKQVMQQFQESKTKNNGKEYSPVNEQYALQSYQDFVKKGDPKGWKEAYQNIKGYTPYYDYHKEITDNIKNCHPSSVTQAGVNGMYMTSTTTSGVSASQLSGCVGSNLSGQAEEQMRMEGVVKYGHNYQALADDYMPVANGNRQYLATQRAQLATQLATKGITPEQTTAIRNQLKQFDGQISNIDDSIDRYHKGDISFFRNNYETLAGATYRGQKLQSIGSAFQYNNVKQEQKADPIQMMLSNQRAQAGLQNQRLQYESQKDQYDWDNKFEIEAMKLNKKVKKTAHGYEFIDPDLAANPNIYIPSITGADVTSRGVDNFNSDLAGNTQARQSNDQWLYNHLKTNTQWKEDTPDPRKDPQAFQAFVDGLAKSPNLNDIPLQQAFKKREQLSLDYALLHSTQQAVETSPVARAAKGTIQNFLSGITQGEDAITMSTDGKTKGHLILSPQEVRDLLTTGASSINPGIHLSKQRGYPGYGSAPVDVGVINMGGESFNLTPRLQQLLVQRDQHTNNYQSTMDNLYRDKTANQHTWIDLGSENDDLKAPNALRRTIGDALAPIIGHGDNSVNAVKDIILQGSDFAGKVRFSIKGDAKGNQPDQEKIIQQLAAAGYSNVQAVPNTTGTYEISGVGVSGGINYNRPEVSAIRKMQSFAENLQDIHQRGLDTSPRIPMPSFGGIDVAGVKGPNGELYFELSDPSKPGNTRYATSAADLTSKLNALTTNQ